MAYRPESSDSDGEQEGSLLAALVELHRKKQRNARRAAGENAYARVLEHFDQRGKRLRGELLLTEELIERSLGDASKLPPQTQQELEIVGPVGDTASGRFRVHNRTTHPALVEIVVGEPLSGPTPVLSFEPKNVELAAGAAALVRVMADLRVFREPGSCTVPVECRAGGRRDRLWLIVTAFSRNGSEP
ncbi:MAG: hypothetical protein ACHQ53_11985 [Polyangiales bacterium]